MRSWRTYSRKHPQRQERRGTAKVAELQQQIDAFRDLSTSLAHEDAKADVARAIRATVLARPPRGRTDTHTRGFDRCRRVEYDLEREAAALERSGYPDAYRLAEMRRLARYLPPGV